MENKIKTVLVSISDDRFGRKDGMYEQTQDKITKIFENSLNKYFGIEVLPYKWHNIEYTQFYKDNEILLSNKDAARNGRAYKPYVIARALEYLKEGEFLIYNDCSPEIWKTFKEDYTINPIYNLNIIHNLTIKNNDILCAFVKWDKKPIEEGKLGIHTHKNFTLNKCMNRMGLRFYEDSYMPASGFWCIRKTKDTIDFINEWLHYNLIDECCSLGKANIEGDTSFWEQESHLEFGKEGYKYGHRHDQSISGLLLSRQNHKFIDIIYNDVNPYNFLQFCRTDTEYKFIESNESLISGDKVINKQGTELNVYRIEDNKYVVGQNEQSCYATNRENLKKL